MMLRCHNCVLFVRQGAVKCPHCGIYLSRSLSGLSPASPDAAPASLQDALADLERRRARHRGHAMRGGVALLAIFATLVMVWRVQRLGLDPASRLIATPFETFEATFGPASPLTPEQKDLEFGRYRGEYVRWEGTILYLNAAGAEPHASLRCSSETHAFASDVTLYVRPQDWDRLAARRVGDRLRFIGCLADYGRDGAPVVLQDGRTVEDGQ